jgi:hypothetical protein
MSRRAVDLSSLNAYRFPSRLFAISTLTAGDNYHNAD